MTFPSRSLLFDLTVIPMLRLHVKMLLLKLTKEAQLGFASEAGILKRTDSFYHASSIIPNAMARGKQLLHTILYPSLPSEHLLLHHGLSQLPLLSLLSLEKAKVTQTRKLPLHPCPGVYIFFFPYPFSAFCSFKISD